MAELLKNYERDALLNQLHSDWHLSENALQISRTFSFKNYYQCMAFVNAVAWIAHQQDHHPDMQVSYNQCEVTYSTHSAGGLTMLDFEAARDVDSLDSSD